jgi:hypothetical protein
VADPQQLPVGGSPTPAMEMVSFEHLSKLV